MTEFPIPNNSDGAIMTPREHARLEEQGRIIAAAILANDPEQRLAAARQGLGESLRAAAANSKQQTAEGILSRFKKQPKAK